MRWLALGLLYVGCSGGRPPEGATEQEASDWCEALRESDPTCFQPETLDDCVGLYRECGERIEIVEDCPMAFDCPSSAGS